MDLKKLFKKILFPHIAIMIILVPIATVFLIGSMVFIGTESAIAIVSYVIAAYTLTVWCFRIPNIIKFFKEFKKENKYAQKWINDTRLRIKVSLYGSFVWNAVYGIFSFGSDFITILSGSFRSVYITYVLL